MKKLFVFILICFCNLQAITVIFSGTDSTLDFETASGSFTLDGLTITLEANTGTVNATNSSLGINAAGSGDDTDNIDFDAGGEVLTVSFDQDVIFNSIGLNGFGVSDSLGFQFDSDTPISLSSTSSRTFDTRLNEGEVLQISSGLTGNGVGITSFQVTTIGSVVPEPSTAMLASLGLSMMLMRRRRP